MTTISTCPESEKLVGLIRGDLPQEELERMTAHLESCETCQIAIQSIATGEVAIDAMLSRVGDLTPPKESAYWNAVSTASIEAVGETDPGLSAPSSGDRRRALEHELDFLEPAEDSAYMGRLQHFLVSRVIGRGGMGVVLEAFDTHLHRTVAIKVLNAEFQENDIAKQRFCREGRAAAAITHEHVVAMHQVSKQGDGKIAFLVMQYIDGETLEERLADGQPLPIEDVARFGMQMAAGLSAAHSRGMIHRDIKPANVLIEKETGRIKLTDFGLARANDEVKLTKTGLVTGTPLYMSPEQATGGEPDERSDLFSLGAVMYEMATGQSAFQSSSVVGVMKKVMEETPEAPAKLNPEVSPALSTLIMKLIEKRADDRPDSSAEVARVFASIVTQIGPISPLQVPAVGESEVKRLSGNHRATINRNWMIATLAASVIAIVGLSSAGTLWLHGVRMPTIDLGKSGAKFDAIALSGNPGSVWAADFLPDGRRLVAGVEDGSIAVWDFQSSRLIKSFNAHRGVIWVVRYDKNNHLFASCGDDGLVRLWDADTFEMIRQWECENATRGIAFSPDGTRIAVAGRAGDIQVFQIEGGEEVVAFKQPGAIFGIDYSPDGKLLVTGGSDRVVRLFDAETLEVRQQFLGHDGPVYALCFSKVNPLVASVGWGDNIRIWNHETGAEVAKLPSDSGDIWAVSFCETSERLVTASQDGNARIWDLTDNSLEATLVGHTSTIHNVAFDPSPASHRIATTSRDGSIRVWDLSSLAEK
ncbi:MAG: protein kinase [Planctomycetota bacterium]